jgi:amidase
MNATTTPGALSVEEILAGPPLLLVTDDGGTRAAELLARVAREAPGAGAWVAAGRCDARLAAPLGPFADLLADVAEALGTGGKRVTERHGMTLASILSGHPRAALAGQNPFRAGLASFSLQGDPFGLREFFQGRNVSYRVVDDVVRLLLDASLNPPPGVGGPLVLCIDRVEEADSITRSVLRLLGRYGAGHPLRVVAAAAPGTPLPGDGWRRVEPAPGSAPPALSAAARELLAAASVVPGWLSPQDLESLGEGSGELAAAGLLADWGARGVAVPAAVARRVADALPDGERRARHARAAGLEPASVFARALHQREGGLPGFGAASLEAAVAAWALSAYPEAIHHATHAFADSAVAEAHDRDLVLALLQYEAGDARSTDDHLRAAIARTADPLHRSLLHRLAGYNGVFGLKEYEYGLELLTRSRDYLRDARRLRDVGWIQNAMAFALVHLKRPADALALEEESLELARHLPQADRYLLAILQLNLGRLRRKSSLEEAAGYFRRSLADAQGQVDQMLLLLFYLTLANLYAAHDRPAEALSYYRRAADLGMDRDLGGFSDRLFALTTHALPTLAEGEARTLRVDAARLQMALLMASMYRRLGATVQAERQERWVARELARLGIDDPLPPAVEAAPAASAQGGDEGVEPLLAAHAELVAYTRPADPAHEVAALLAAGHAVAVLTPAFPGVPGEMESLVLFDPRAAELRARVLADLGRTVASGGVVALEAAGDAFEGAAPEFPGVVQEASLRRDLRTGFPRGGAGADAAALHSPRRRRAARHPGGVRAAHGGRLPLRRGAAGGGGGDRPRRPHRPQVLPGSFRGDAPGARRAGGEAARRRGQREPPAAEAAPAEHGAPPARHRGRRRDGAGGGAQADPGGDARRGDPSDVRREHRRRADRGRGGLRRRRAAVPLRAAPPERAPLPGMIGTRAATDLGAVELAAEISARSRSCREVAAELLEHASRAGPGVNAFAFLDAEGAMRRAGEADAALERGGGAGVLHGVPFTVKDALAAAGLPASCGAPELAGHVPALDAPPVARLLASGAVLLGKTNAPTLGGDYQTSNPLAGTTRNPWDPGRTPGGSSGGSAAAVAAGFSPLDVCSDLGGSIRIPAHYCGVFGLKPTGRRVPMTGHVPPMPGKPRGLRNLAAVGLVARSVADLRVGLELIAGPDGSDTTAPPVPLRLAAPRPPGRRRVAWAASFPGAPLAREHRAGIERVAATLEGAGWEAECSLPQGFDLHDAAEVYGGILAAELTSTYHPDRQEAEREQHRATGMVDSPEPYARGYARAVGASMHAYTRLIHRRDAWIRRVEGFLGGYDAWLLPVAPSAAIPHTRRGAPVRVDGEEWPYLAQGWYSFPFSLTDHPAVVVPLGLDGDGLPFGVQVVGRLWHDLALLDVAEEIGRLVPRLPYADCAARRTEG